MNDSRREIRKKASTYENRLYINLGRQPDDCQNSYLRSICKDWMVKPNRMKCSTFVRGERIAAIFRLSTLFLASIRLINSSMNVRFRRIRLTRNN